MEHREVDVKFIWNMLSDFWEFFEDKETISQVWRTLLQSLSNIYYQLYQVSLSKGIETIPFQWISDWEPVTLDKTTYINTEGILVYYKKIPVYFDGVEWDREDLKKKKIIVYNPELDNWFVDSRLGNRYYKGETYENTEEDVIYYNEEPVYMKDINWNDPSLLFSNRNPEGIMKFDNSIKQWYVKDISGNIHYRDFPHEYMFPRGLKDSTYLVETPRNGVKFNQKAVNKKKGTITYENGSVRPFETELLTDQNGFSTPYVANGVLTSGGPGTQDYLILPSDGSSIPKIFTKTKINNTLWSHVGIRNSYNVYECFGYLLKFFKPDSVKYLREIQGLWLSYLSSPTIASLQRGFTVLRDLPFALQSGVITKLDQSPTKLIMSHVKPLYKLAPNEDTTLLDPRNNAYNPKSVEILTEKQVYESDGTLRKVTEDPELEAKPFLEQALSVGDYVYSLNDKVLVATFSFNSVERDIAFPTRIFRECEDRTVVTSFCLDNKYYIRLHDRIISSYIPFTLPEPGTVLEVDEYDRVVGTPFSVDVFKPIKVGDIITAVVEDGTESYLEVNYDTRFSITAIEAMRLNDDFVRGFTVMYMSNPIITIGSTANVRLDEETFYQLHEGDYISYISPAILTIGINNEIYTYHTDGTLSVAFGQYINKYDPLINSVNFIDYIKDPNWIFREMGNLNKNNWKTLADIADMWHTFIVEVDEYSLPDTFETSKLINNFIKSAKPTYVNYRMIGHIYLEDTMVITDELERLPKYEFETEYPWAGRGLLDFDNEIFFDDYHFDDRQRFDDSEFADPMREFLVRDHVEMEDTLIGPMCLDDGILADGSYTFNSAEAKDSLMIYHALPENSDWVDTLFRFSCYDQGMLFDNGGIHDVSCDTVEITKEY